MPTRAALTVLMAFALIAAACSDDDDSTSAGEAGASTTAPSAATTAAPPATTAPSATTTPATTAAPTTTVAPTTSTTPALPDDYVGHVSEVYAGGANWVCRPGVDDVCARDLDATAVHADGTTELVAFEPATDPIADCFYVYPTVSRDSGVNSDLIPGEEEIGTTLNQAARLGASCRVFAPMYRQVTLNALFSAEGLLGEGGDLAYADVVDAFRHFIANDSDGRPFVLVGHSPGSLMLERLLDEEIDDQPVLRDRLVSAMLLGWNVAADRYENVAVCATADDTGCLVTYVSFRDTSPPPPEGSFFGRTEGGPAACVNPTDPAGGAASSQVYFAMPGAQAFDDAARSAEITTPFVTYPDMVTVECVDDGTFGYLELSITGEDGPRVDDIGGDLSPEWGMHIVDVNVAMGDLVDLVASQSAAWAAR